jgi:hypothetical protein
MAKMYVYLSLLLIENWSLLLAIPWPKSSLGQCMWIHPLIYQRPSQAGHLGHAAQPILHFPDVTIQYFLFSHSIRLLSFISLPKAENPSRSTSSRDVYREVWGQSRWRPKSRSSFTIQVPTISDFGRDPPSERSIAAATNKVPCQGLRGRGCGAHVGLHEGRTR